MPSNRPPASAPPASGPRPGPDRFEKIEKIGLLLGLCLIVGLSSTQAALATPPARPAEQAPSRIPDGAFVRARGPSFEVGGRTFRFLGANFDPLHGRENRLRYRELIGALARDGMTVGRVWVFGDGQADAAQWRREEDLFRVGPYGFVEAAYEQLDRVLAEARERGIRLILTLTNHWSDYGGVPTYIAWAKEHGGAGKALYVEDFYANPITREHYRAALDRLLERTNTVTGGRYVDDPTIFSWELMNESLVWSPEAEAGRLAWVREMARHIKERDPNHMVSPGMQVYASREARRRWIELHRLPEVDYCDSHLYVDQLPSTNSFAEVLRTIDDRAQLARFVIGKPLVIGEFGFPFDRAPEWLKGPRARWFDRFLRRFSIDGGAGALVWIYALSASPREFGIYTDAPSSQDVRLVLQQHASRLRRGESGRITPILSRDRGVGPLYRLPEHPIVRAPKSRRTRDGFRIEIDPETFSQAAFAAAGWWDERGARHVYGKGEGEFRYSFQLPWVDRTPVAVQIEARLSADAADRSADVEVLLDGQVIGQLEVPPGSRPRVERLLGRSVGLRAGAEHTLVLRTQERGLKIFSRTGAGRTRTPIRVTLSSVRSALQRSVTRENWQRGRQRADATSPVQRSSLSRWKGPTRGR